MKLKTSTIVDSNQAFGFLFGKELPVAASHALSVAFKQARPIIESYEAERLRLVEKFADKDEDGKAKVAGSEYVLANRNGFDAALKSVRDVEVEVGIVPIHIAALGDMRLPASIFIALDWLFAA